MNRVDPRQFQNALAALRVHIAEENGSLVATIDLSPLAAFVRGPFSSSEAIRFRFDPSHELTVFRPPALAVTRTRHWLIGPDHYPWTGGVPRGRSFLPPSIRSNKRKAQYYQAPIRAVLRRATYEAELWHTCQDAADSTAARLRKDVWRAIGAAMNPRALAHADRFDLDWSKYLELQQRPDLCDFLDTAPGIGPRFRPLPEGLPWESMVVRLLGFSGVDKDGNYQTYGRHPAFQTWVRRVPYSRKILPRLSEGFRGIIGHKNPPWFLIQNVARAAENGWLRVDGLEKLDTPLQWLILHTAVSYQNHRQIRWLLNNPQAAEAAFVRTFPRAGRTEPVWVDEALRDIREWEREVSRAAQDLEKWGATLGQPELVQSSQAARLKTMESVCRHVWRREMLTRRLRLTMFNRADLVMHAPVRALEQIIVHPDFEWNEKVFQVLLHRRSCRRNATIRPLLLERAATADDLLDLLNDGVTSETRLLWNRLARQAPERALDYLEKNGFDPRAGWQFEDLIELFQRGGKISIRAMLLLADLQDPQQVEQPEMFPSQPQPRTSSGRSI